MHAVYGRSVLAEYGSRHKEVYDEEQNELGRQVEGVAQTQSEFRTLAHLPRSVYRLGVHCRLSCFSGLFCFLGTRDTAFSRLGIVCLSSSRLCDVLLSRAEARRRDSLVLYDLAVVHRKLTRHVRLRLFVVMCDYNNELVSRHFCQRLHYALR